MSDSALIAAYGAMLLAGLAGSLHCIGMCGPLLVGFSQMFAKRDGAADIAADGATSNAARSSVARDLALYHCGRIWTYAMLGFVAGLIGDAARHGSTWLGWQRPVMVSISVLVVGTGVLMLGVIPAARLDRVVAGCGLKQINARPWLKGLARHGSLTSRLLLGAVMGLLPCGLVYAALIMAAAMPSPAHAALGMIAFGVGTLPSLSAVFLAIGLVPLRWRAHGTKIAACVVIATGAWMTWRAATIDPSCGCHRPSETVSVAPTAAPAPAPVPMTAPSTSSETAIDGR